MKYSTKPVNVPEFKISTKEHKPFSMWFLITKSKAEFKFNWKFWGAK